MFIKARVSHGLLKKADRLFTGTVDGRIIELVQNSRRANAKNIWITQEPIPEVRTKSRIIFRDDGEGIKDFLDLLDLGGLHWGEEIAEAEDPGGIGLFSLAPGRVEILSHGQKVVIEGEGWWGAPVEVKEVDHQEAGTTIIFEDESWGAPSWNGVMSYVHELPQHGKYSGVKIHYNNIPFPQKSFLTPSPQCEGYLPTHYPDLGVHIQVIPHHIVSGVPEKEHYRSSYSVEAFMNFYGHILSVPYAKCHWAFRDTNVEYGGYGYTIAVDMTGEPTPLRLMLPARTQFVENDALKELQKAITTEVYRYFLRFGSHRIPYANWLEAKEMGIDLPEAKPTYAEGVNHHDRSRGEADAEHLGYHVTDLSKAIRCTPKTRVKLFIDGKKMYDEECRDAEFPHLQIYNTLLCDEFPVVRICGGYKGYSWYDLPGEVTSVRIDLGNRLDSGDAGSDSMTLSVYEEMKVTVAWSQDGTKHRKTADFDSCWDNDCVDSSFAISKDALLHHRGHTHLWYLAGGYNDSSEDSYSKQSDNFDEEVQQIRDRFVSPYETLRRNCVEKIEEVCGRRSYESITVEVGGNVHIKYRNGQELFMTPNGSVEKNGGEECSS
jgi:hypothetical protein